MVAQTGHDSFNIATNITSLPGSIDLHLGMDLSMFYHDTRWDPQYDLQCIILSLFNYFRQNQQHKPSG